MACISVISVDKTKLKNLRRFNKSWYCDMLANIYIWTTLSRPWAENFESLLVFWWTKNPTTVQPRLRRTQQNYPGKRSRRDTFTSLKKRTCTTHIPQPFLTSNPKKEKIYVNIRYFRCRKNTFHCMYPHPFVELINGHDL